MDAHDVRLSVDAHAALRVTAGDGALEGTDVSRWDVTGWCEWFGDRPTNGSRVVVEGFAPLADDPPATSSMWATTFVALVYALEAARLSGVPIEAPGLGGDPGSWDMDVVQATALHESGSYACTALIALFRTYVASGE